MPNTIDQVIQYAQDHPKRDGKSWAGWCESFVWRAGGFDGSFGSALLAGNASGPLNGEWAKAPRGAIHYWAGVGGDGHVAFELGGGTLLMASSRTSNYGTALGTIHFTDYGLPNYRGWSMRHGTQALAGSTSIASSGATPLEDDMPITDADVVKILTGQFDSGLLNPDGTARWVGIADGIRSVLWYEDRIHSMAAKLPADVWAHPLVHTLATTDDGAPLLAAAGDLLRYEPAEHENTRRITTAAIGTGGVDIDYDQLVESLKASGLNLDPQAIAVFAADEADRRERERLGK